MVCRRPTACALLLSALAGTGASLFAQTSDRSALAGHVTDPTGAAVPGAAIRIESASLIGGAREIETDAAGAYRVTDLSPGVYRVEARAPLFKTASRENLRLEADARLVVDLRLFVEALTETVQVRDVPPVVDVTSAATPARLTSTLLDSLPTSRTVSDLMNLLPGVNASIGFGGVQLSNPLVIDGLNVADAQAMSPWASFAFTWLEDLQVVGPGAGAEYGEFSGVAQRARLRSGGNRFSGLGEFRTTRPSWTARNTSSLPPSLQTSFANQSERVLEWWETSLQVGGPVRRDRLWFFAGVERASNRVQPALYAGPDATHMLDRRLLAKIDAAPASAVRLSVFYSDDRNEIRGDGLGALTPLEATATTTLPNHNWHARVTQMAGDHTAIEWAGGGSRGTLSFNPTPPATRAGPSPRFDAVTGLSTGNAAFFEDDANARQTLGTSVTHARVGRAHTHELAAGIEYEWADFTHTSGIPSGQSFQDVEGVPAFIYAQAPNTDRSRTRRLAAYASDQWTVGSRLSLQPGVRVALNRGVVSQGTVLRTAPVSPRIGMAWDLAPDHRTVLRVHYGRYHDAVLTAQATLADTLVPNPLIEYTVGGSGQLVETFRSTATPPVTIDGRIRQSYFDQWTAGLERQVGSAASVSAQYVGRVYRDLMGYVDLGSIYEPVARTDPGPDNRLGTADDGGTLAVFRKTNPGSERFVFTNPAGVQRRYDALQLVTRRHGAGSWQGQASYTWSSTRGNAVNGARANAAGPDLGTNGVAADPNRAINADGPVPFDFTHEVKVLAAWRVPRIGVTASGVYQAHTGSAWGRTAQLQGLQLVTFGVRVEPRGTRRTPALGTLDLRFEKTFEVRRIGRAGVFADVFNATNQGIPDTAARRPMFEVSGPSFGQPQFWTDPRTLRAGLRLTF